MIERPLWKERLVAAWKQASIVWLTVYGAEIRLRGLEPERRPFVQKMSAGAPGSRRKIWAFYRIGSARFGPRSERIGYSAGVSRPAINPSIAESILLEALKQLSG